MYPSFELAVSEQVLSVHLQLFSVSPFSTLLKVQVDCEVKDPTPPEANGRPRGGDERLAMAAIGKGKGKLAGNNHLGGDGVYCPASSGGASGAKDRIGAGGNNGVWSDGEGVVEMKDQVGGDLVKGMRKAKTCRIIVECTICKDDITDHERNPCVRAPCCKAIAQ